jgi:hypothetical protein
MKTFYLFLLLSILISFSTGYTQDSRLPNGVEFEVRHLSKTLDGCDTTSTDCPQINITYDFMSSGNDKDFYNLQAEKELLDKVYQLDDKTFTSLQDMADTFINDYSVFRKEYPDAPSIGWYADVNYMNVNDLSGVLSFELSWEMFTGGAHPNNYQRYYNYDYSTAKLITLDQIFVPGFEKKLNELVVKAFREENNLGPNEPLTEGGLFEDTLTYSDNFLLTRNGIIFHYNIYEVRAYVYGPMDLTVKYSDLIDLINENGIGVY